MRQFLLCSCLLCLGALPAVAGQMDAQRYGTVRIETDDPALQPAAARWLSDLRPGAPIDDAVLQRRLLLIRQLPGVSSQSVLGAGAAPGERDLQVTLQRGPRYSGSAGLDNHGSRFTGEQRAFANLDLESLWTLGDTLSLGATRRWHGTWSANVGYSLPLGRQGLRGLLEFEHGYYQLHRERRHLNAHGTSDILLLQLSYPLWLGEEESLRASLGWEITHADDEARARDGSPRLQHRRLHLLPLSLSGERKNARGMTSARLTWGWGRLTLDRGSQKEDSSTDRSAGHYQLLIADLRREQRWRKDWTLYGRFYGQKSSRNLDSEKWFVLGGPLRARAWTGSEAQGDEGWLFQAELRRRLGALEPFVFADLGKVKLRRRPWRKGDNWRALSGAGLGLRWTQDAWSAQAAVAWRTGGHRPGSRLGYRNPRIWLGATYRF